VPAPPAPIGEGQNYGVKVLHDGGPEAGVDIVFVHGLTGNAYNTWLHNDTMVHWPSQILRHDIPDVRILSFGYDADIVNLWNPASKSRLSNHAENMVGDLVRKRERTNTETRKILFVAHSLGGLITEHALSHSRNAVEGHLHQIERCTAGMIFLGVPHYGADLASWVSFGTRMASVLRQANEDIVKVLEPGSEMLRVVQKGFHNILRLRKDEGSEISITCFYEELGVIGVGEVW
jgi:pimeloyl-ACP methyl ester carboxylesterase